MNNNPVIALIGNPNSGKTTLFNKLTGSKQHVGNWPGVTVEKKLGKMFYKGHDVEIVDLPGTYNLSSDFNDESVDERIAQQYISEGEPDVLINIIDASSLERGLHLTYQLIATGTPLIVALNMTDVAASKGYRIDHEKLSHLLGCPVIPIIASRNEGFTALKETLIRSLDKQSISPAASQQMIDNDDTQRTLKESDKTSARKKIEHIYQQVDATCEQVLTKEKRSGHPISDIIDNIVLNRIIGFPIFLLAIYLLFFFAVNLGSAFQDFFNIFSGLVFIDIPRWLLTAIHMPAWITALICDGIGGGIQLIIQFIPVIAALFFALSFLEDVGYMTRAAFVVDRLMKSIGLPGKAFIPLIIGFGCNVPSIMATRTLNKESDRLITSLMSPFMSCGARLTVYTFFVAAFFPVNGQNILFILYCTGIVVAILTAFLVRRFIFQSEESSSIMELSPYLMPTTRNLLTHTWNKLKGFALRAGKSIITVVIILNLLNSVGTDGTFGHQNQKDSVLSKIGQTITPIFSPIGLEKENWPATVGIFTGIFAKEVVVGTLNELYSGTPEKKESLHIIKTVKEALLTIPANVSAAFSDLSNPLGIPSQINTNEVTKEQGINKGTFKALREYFEPVSAFAYLVFILLYMPCVATIGAIVKEHGGFWASFSLIWSYSVAYFLSVAVYQIGTWSSHPLSSFLWVGGLSIWQLFLTGFVLHYGKKHALKQRLIPSVEI